MEKKLSTKIAAAGIGIAALAGIAIASPAIAAGTTPSIGSGSSSTAPSFGQGEGKRGHHGMGRGMNINATPQTVTVNVPTDGTYQLSVRTYDAAGNVNISPLGNPADQPTNAVTIDSTGISAKLSVATVHNYLSFLRTYAAWIGRPGMVRDVATYFGDDSHYVHRDRTAKIGRAHV